LHRSRPSPGQTNARFEPFGRLTGTVTPPADKSISHRAALFGAMSDEPVSVRNYLRAADTESTLNVVQALGAGVDDSGDELVIRGVGLHTPAEVTGGLLDVGNSGTLLRLLPGWLSGQPGGEWTLDGDDSIRRRPVDRVAGPLRQMGASIDTRDGGLPPMLVRGGSLTGIDYDMPVASAQVKTCVLIAGLLASGSTTVTEPSQSRDHTERILCRARVPFTREGLSMTVQPVDELELDHVIVPGDPSSAAFLTVAACLVPNSRIVIEGMCLNWTRTGFFRIAQRMGAVIVGDLEEPGEGSETEEPIGEVDVASSPLVATEVTPEEVPLAIDELPLVGLLGCFAEGDTVVRGAEELRVKETDRIAGVVEGLNGLGANLEATDDGFVVHGGTGIEGGTIDSRGDHRLAMLGAVAGLASQSGVEVLGMDAADVSYPDFERDLRALLER
jgi:3-phosphoshikimate 1-carboxyvinyltransferase